MADLGPAGVQAARSTLIELSKAVARRQFDDVEPRLAPALVQAAKDLADSRLDDPELSSAMLARELNVSIRTLAVRRQQPLHPGLQKALRPDTHRLRPLDPTGQELSGAPGPSAITAGPRRLARVTCPGPVAGTQSASD